MDGQLPPAEAVSQALGQSPLDIDGVGVTLRVCEDDIIRSRTEFGVELARLRVLDPAPVVHSKLVLKTWLQELSQSGSPVQAAHAFYALSRGMRFLPRNHERAPTRSPNYFTAEHAPVVRKEFTRLAAMGYTCAADDIKAVDILAIGCVVKGELGTDAQKVRCVVNASAPLGDSINDDITSFGVTFPRLQDAGECLRIGTFMWKGDISDMYLNFPLRPDMYPHTVVELDGQRIVYLFLCFGIRSAVRLAQGVSVLITEILRRRMRAAGVQDDTVLGVFEYLDDWLGCHDGADGGWSARTSFLCWMSLMRSLGLPFTIWKRGKVVPPTNKGLTYLGIFLSTSPVPTYTLTPERIVQAVALINAFLELGSSVSLHDVQRLHGLLCFLCVALPVGSHLLFWLRQLMSVGATTELTAVRRRHVRCLKVHKALHADLGVFLLVLELFNGREVTAAAHRRHLPFNLESDSSVYGGCAFFGGHFIRKRWDCVHESADMCILEARMVRIALEDWGAGFANTVLHITVDNQGVRDLLQGGSVRRSPELQAEFVRIIVLQIQYNLVIIPHWCASEDNVLPDAGSRCFAANPAEQSKYTAIFESELAAWHRQHRRWQWRRCRSDPCPDAHILWRRWCDLTRALPLQAGVKRKYLTM